MNRFAFICITLFLQGCATCLDKPCCISKDEAVRRTSEVLRKNGVGLNYYYVLVFEESRASESVWFVDYVAKGPPTPDAEIMFFVNRRTGEVFKPSFLRE